MGTVLIRCPNTKSYVFTGITMDYSTFSEGDLGSRKVHCPKCGEVHHWGRKDAFLHQLPARR